jgi:hypothetical protein
MKKKRKLSRKLKKDGSMAADAGGSSGPAPADSSAPATPPAQDADQDNDNDKYPNNLRSRIFPVAAIFRSHYIHKRHKKHPHHQKNEFGMRPKSPHYPANTVTVKPMPTHTSRFGTTNVVVKDPKPKTYGKIIFMKNELKKDADQSLQTVPNKNTIANAPDTKTAIGYIQDYHAKISNALKSFMARKNEAIAKAQTLPTKAARKKALNQVASREKYLSRGVDFSDYALKHYDASVPPRIAISKLAKEKYKGSPIFSFGLPAGHTCPKKGVCFGECYALQWQYDVNPKNIQARKDNWASSARPDFAPRMIDELKKKKYKPGSLFRIHDSGDMYSQEYADKWHQIAQAHLDKHFYAYTKSLHLDKSKLHSLPNFKLIQSVGGAQDKSINLNEPHAVIFPNIEELKRHGYSYVGNDDSVAADPAVIKVGLVHHGTKGTTFEPNEYSNLGINLADTQVRKVPKESAPIEPDPSIKKSLKLPQEHASLSGHTIDQPDFIDTHKVPSARFKLRKLKPNLKA